MTGEELFLRYAFPCAYEKETRGIISVEQKKELEDCLANNKKPRRRLLKTCFSHAFQALRDLAEKTGTSTWSIRNVKNYWLDNHRGFGDCGIAIIAVSGINGKIITVSNSLHEHQVINLYNLDLKIRNHVICHKGCVIEKI